jgi:hypothetical protein
MRYLKWLLLILLIGGLAYGAYLYFYPQVAIKATRVVPGDAVFIAESREPVSSFQAIQESKLWQHLTSHAYFAALDTQATAIDSLIQNNETLFDLLGNRNLTLSTHKIARNNFDFLFLIDVEKGARLAMFRQALKPVLAGSGYVIEETTYEGKPLIRMQDKESGKILYMTLIDNILGLSYTRSLVEDAITTAQAPVLPKDPRFTQLRQEVDAYRMFNIYVVGRNLKNFLRVYSDEPGSLLGPLDGTVAYSGFDLSLAGEVWRMNGRMLLQDDTASILHALVGRGHGERHAYEVATGRTGVYTSFQFEDFGQLYEDFSQQMAQNAEGWSETQAKIKKVEEYLGIDLKQDFFSWFGNEVALCMAQPKTGRGEEDRFLIIHTDPIAQARQSMAAIQKHIKRRTPVKFEPKAYKDYTIQKFKVKGFFKLFLGKMFKDFEKPYFAFIDNFLVLSTNMRKLQYFIDDYEADNTLANEPGYQAFHARFPEEGNVFTYVNMARMHPMLRSYVGPETWAGMRRNKRYLTSFRHLGLHLTGDEQGFDSQLRLHYDTARVENLRLYKTQATDTMDTLHQLDPPPDFQDGKVVTRWPDGSPKIEGYFLDGQLQGDYRAYYPDGDLRVQGQYQDGVKTGIWYFYRRNGNKKKLGQYRNGRKYGTWKYYDRRGRKRDEEHFQKPDTPGL